MVAQSYLSWISDQDLFNAISHVSEKYKRALKAKNLKSFSRNVVDPFMLVFDVTLNDTELIEDQLIDEIKSQLNARILSNQDLIEYFFEVVYPNSSETAKLQQLMLQAKDKSEDELQETDGDIDDNETD